MKKPFVSLLLLLLPLVLLFSASMKPSGLEDTFESEEELKGFDFEAAADDSWNDVAFSLITISEGEPVYSWFGHTSLEVESADYDYDYNWGVFTIQDGFYKNFLLGRLYYSLYVNNAYYSRLKCESEGREMQKLELDLTPESKKAVAAFLNYNAKEENRTYLYHYYLDNCSTRVRDIYNAATLDEFRQWAESIDTGLSFRDYTTQRMNSSFIVNWTLNALQGPMIDKKINLYEACFIPSVLNSAIEQYQGSKAEVIIEAESEVLVPDKSNLLPLSLLIALLLFMAIVLLPSRLAYIVEALSTLYFFTLSAVLAFFIFATDHDVTYFNENLIFLNPLLLITLISAVKNIFKNRKHGKAAIITYRVLASAAITLLVMKGLFPSLFYQENLPQISLMLSFYAGVLIRERKRRKSI